MDAHPALTPAVGFVDSIDLFNDRLNGIAAEFVAEYIQADVFIFFKKHFYRM